MNSLERRHKDILKRFERKLNGLNSAAKSVDDILQDIQENRKWVANKMQMLASRPSLGFEVSAAEKQLHNLRVNN